MAAINLTASEVNMLMVFVDLESTFSLIDFARSFRSMGLVKPGWKSKEYEGALTSDDARENKMAEYVLEYFII
jgi:hypothetical protein